MKDKPSIFEWVTFWVFVILEVCILLLRIFSPTVEFNRVENVLYSTFEIVFSLYIGYFIQRIDSIRQFEESLKQYGLSAYRRVMDISRSIDRTITQIERIGVNYPKDKTRDIDVLHMMLEGTFDTVKSSVSDWGDIIGEEIRKKERAYLLQEELARSERLSPSAENKSNIEELKRELKKINSELPIALMGDHIIREIDQRNLTMYAHHFEYVINRDHGVTLYIKPNVDISEESIGKIMDSQPLFFHMIYDRRGNPPFEGMETMRCIVYDRDKNEIGEVINPIEPQLDRKYYVSELQFALDYLQLRDKESSIPIYKFNNLRYVGITNDRAMLIVHIPIEVGYFPRG